VGGCCELARSAGGLELSKRHISKLSFSLHNSISFFIGLFVSFAVDVESGSKGLLALISIHPVGALSYGLQVIGVLEDDGIGMQSNTIDSSDSISGWTVNNSLQFLIIDSLIYGFLVGRISLRRRLILDHQILTQFLVSLPDLVSESHCQGGLWSAFTIVVSIYGVILVSQIRTSPC